MQRNCLIVFYFRETSPECSRLRDVLSALKMKNDKELNIEVEEHDFDLNGELYRQKGILGTPTIEITLGRRFVGRFPGEFTLDELESIVRDSYWKEQSTRSPH